MLRDDIEKRMHTALKERKTEELSLFRLLISAIRYEEIKKQHPLSDAEVIGVLQKEVKKRQEAVTLFEKGNRRDLIEKEKNDIARIQQYLPPPVSDEEIMNVIREIQQTNTSPAETGKLIGIVIGRMKGQVDGARVAVLVQKAAQKS